MKNILKGNDCNDLSNDIRLLPPVALCNASQLARSRCCSPIGGGVKGVNARGRGVCVYNGWVFRKNEEG